MHRCIIINDDPYAIEKLTDFIAEIPILKLVNTYTNPLHALFEILNDDVVDLILLDVEMPNISGIDLFSEIRHKTKKLIFTTGSMNFAFEALQANADGYLLKPFKLSRFAGLVTKLFPRTRPNYLPAKAPEIDNGDTYFDNEHSVSKEYFFIKTRGKEAVKLLRVNFADVVAVESMQNYVHVHLRTKSIIAYTSLAEVKKILSSEPYFYQFQRSFIISERFIESIEGNIVKMIGGKVITVGASYKKPFVDFITSRLLRSLKPEK